jgi:predicted naringenin-chalcone synthase
MQQFQQHATPLALQACRAALANACALPTEITHLVTVTCTGFASPGVEHALIEQLGLPRTTQRAQIGFMGCHAALNGLNVANAFANSSPNAKVLLCSVELCSLHFQYGSDPQRILANALFADGAAAAVISPAPGSENQNAPTIAGHATCLLQNSGGDMSCHIGDHGLEMTLSPRVPGVIADQLRPWLDDFLQQHHLTVPEVRGWAIHAGGPRIVSAVADRLELGPHATDASRAILRDHGNMSSATILFILHRLLTTDTPRPILLLAFGPSLTAEACLLI